MPPLGELISLFKGPDCCSTDTGRTAPDSSHRLPLFGLFRQEFQNDKQTEGLGVSPLHPRPSMKHDKARNSVQKTQKSGLDNHPLWTAAICYHLGVLVLTI